ncbi:retrotransposon gag protein [Rhizoctonia solani 123E]|uniref:Retrotransposon gag protein n=1 Tax=Rhizoctonia solani 123E TaxID=1423351 RepID=A0A074REQ1_9AGAM|nr:retrotransposon gag protein [Rhizoctonia solani 123E]
MPEPLKTSKPQEAKKWLLRVLTWAEYSAGKFPDERALVRYLLAQMEEEAGDWAYPYLGELSNPRNTTPTIRDLQTFGEEFARAFSDPDEERAAARKIVELTQDDVDTKSTTEYATKFKTLAAELTWNDAALMAQFSKGLHWKTKEILSQRERQPTLLRSLMNMATVIDNVRRENEASRKKETGKEKEKGKGKASGTTSGKPTTETTTARVSKEEIDRRKEWGLCIKKSQRKKRQKQQKKRRTKMRNREKRTGALNCESSAPK